MDCSKNRLSSGVNDPDMEVGSVRARPRDVFGISVLLTLLLAILLAMWTVGLEDPHGLSHATPVRAADVPSLEPLYGAVQTPWRSLDWSPDGRQIALTGEADGVTIVEAATGQVAAHWKVPAYTNVIRWSPDGSHLAVGGWTGIVGPGWVYVYTAEGFLERSWEAHSREVGGLAWAPNGTWLATAANARFAIWEAGTGVLVRRVLNASVWGEAADWSPDGHYLAFDAVGGPSIYDAITGEPVYIDPSKETLDVRGPAWSHAGDRIASSNLVGCTRVVTRDGTSVWSYDTPSSGSCDGTWFTRRPSWSPSDDLLAVPTSPGIRVFDAATGTLLRVLAFPVGDYGPSTVIGNYAPGDSRDIDVEWSPIADALASTGSMSNPSLRLWGLPHRTAGLWGLAFEAVLIGGLPVVLGREFFGILREPARVLARRENGPDPIARGGVWLAFAFLVAALQSSVLDVLGRIYGAKVVPPAGWFAAMLILSIAIAAPAVLVGVWAFRAVGWPGQEMPGRPGIKTVARILGWSLVPVLWTAAVAFGIATGLATAGVRPGTEGSSVVVALAGGLGFLLGSRVASGAPRASSIRSAAGLIASGAVSILASLGVFFLIVFGVVAIHVPLPGPLLVYGIQVDFGFGLAPWIAATLTLLVFGVGFVLVSSPPRFLLPLFARLRRQDVLDLKSRRSVMDVLRAQPGIHFRELLRALPMGSGSLHYHLSVLEKEGFIVARRDGIYRRFFPVSATSTAKTS